MSQKFLRFMWAGGAAVGLFVAASIAYAAVPALSQTSVTVGLGQSATVTSTNVPVYLLTNSNATAVSVVINGTQITLTGQGLGGAALTICAVGTASDCTNLGVTVQAGSVPGVSFSPNNFSLPVGGSQAVVVSGGNGTYVISSNSSTSIASASLASSTLTVSGITAGSATITVCDSSNVCGTLSVTITSGSAPNQAITFSVANPALTVGQTLNVTLSSGKATSFVILTNMHPDIAQANITNGSILSLSGVHSGTDLLSICGVGGDCSPLSVTVTGSASTTATTTSTTVAAASTTTQTTAQTTAPAAPSGGTATINASFFSQIQALQTAVAQVLIQLQSIQAQLAELKTQVTASGGTSAGVSASVSSGTSYNFTEFLTLNSESAQVTALQERLTVLGFYSGPITGYYGTLTMQAVMKYQTVHGIAATGFVGPSTRASLNAGN